MMSLKNMVRGSDNDTVAKQFMHLWEHDAGTLKFWRASSNFVYLFERKGVRYFLRFIQEEDNKPEAIQAELDFMQHLIAGGYPTVDAVLSSNGNRMESISTADQGSYYGVVFEQAKGSHLPLDRMSDQQVREWGSSLASLHKLSESYVPAGAKRGSWLDALAFVDSVLQRHPGERDARQELERMRDQLAKLPAGPEDVGLIHYDFETDNVCYIEEESRYCAIDFDDAMIHWYAMDIASAIRDLTKREDDEAGRKIALFIAGYRSVRPLDESWVRLLPLFQRFSDLYSFARLLRSFEGMDPNGSPEWAVQLKAKLLKVCDRMREGYRPRVELKPVDSRNWYACAQLEVSNEQMQVFPVPAVYWLAESAYCGYTPLAMYADGQPVGLAVYAVDPDDGSYWIMAFMIDRELQNKGYGRSGMEALVGYMKEKHACDRIVLGHRPDNRKAASLYASLGFVEKGRDEREVRRELRWTNNL